MASYTYLELINFTLQDLGQATVSTLASTTDKLVLHLMNQANFLMFEISEAEDWDWLYDSSSFVTVANQQEYSAGAGADDLATNAEYYFNFRQQNTPELLVKKDKTWLANTYPKYTDFTGDPYIYVPMGWQTIFLAPIPTSVMTINYAYKKFITKMSSNTDTPDLPEPYQYILLTGLRWQAYKLHKEPGVAEERALYYAQLDKRRENFTRETPGHMPVMAGWGYGENPYG
jgi:hypothetical protein